MTSADLWQQIRQLPIEHKFDTTAQGEISSVQCLTVPRGWLDPAFEVSADHLAALGPFYFRRLPRLLRGLIGVRQAGGETRFTLGPTPLTLLHFGAARVEQRDGGGTACYPIVGGLMLQPRAPGEGALCLRLVPVQDGLRLCMEIQQYYSRLSGSGRVWRSRRLLYTWTQAAAHHWIARDFVRRLAYDLCAGTFGPHPP